MEQRVRLISLTKGVEADYLPVELREPEGLMAYCARVSSPNQENPDYAKLLGYCATHGHWSVFEMADMCVEIVTSRAIAQQIIRHRSFSFQEFSQRYSQTKFGYITQEARRQDKKNRQNSIDDIPAADQRWFEFEQNNLYNRAFSLYRQALDKGIAKECARALLPLSVGTKMYMKGSVRSWIHYCNVRCDPSTQLEHREVANMIQRILVEQFPAVKDCLAHYEE